MKKIKINAKFIWNSLAFIQSKVDDVFDYGFKKLSKMTNKELPDNTNKIKKVIYKTWWFIWNIWKNYYQKYNEIKEEKAKKSGK